MTNGGRVGNSSTNEDESPEIIEKTPLPGMASSGFCEASHSLV